MLHGFSLCALPYLHAPLWTIPDVLSMHAFSPARAKHACLQQDSAHWRLRVRSHGAADRRRSYHTGGCVASFLLPAYDCGCDSVSGVDSVVLPSLGLPAALAMGMCLWMCSCNGRWPSVMGWVPLGLCLWTSSCMCDPKTCLECWLTYFS